MVSDSKNNRNDEHNKRHHDNDKKAVTIRGN